MHMLAFRVLSAPYNELVKCAVTQLCIILLKHKWCMFCMEADNELTLLLIKHDPTQTLVLFRPHRTLCQVVNSSCMCMLVLDGVIAFHVVMENNAVSV